MSFFNALDRRVVSGETIDPEEYDATVTWEGWETEDGTGKTGWDLEVKDRYHDNVIVQIRFIAEDRTLMTRVL